MQILNKPGIYRLAFPDGSYVGQSKNVKSRLKQHKDKILEGIHPNKKIRAGIESHGEPEYEVLEYCSLGALNAAEIHWMDVYDCFPNGYNLKEGGDYTRPYGNEQYINIVLGGYKGLHPCFIFFAPFVVWFLVSLFIPVSAAFLVGVASFIFFLNTAIL